MERYRAVAIGGRQSIERLSHAHAVGHGPAHRVAQCEHVAACGGDQGCRLGGKSSVARHGDAGPERIECAQGL